MVPRWLVLTGSVVSVRPHTYQWLKMQINCVGPLHHWLGGVMGLAQWAQFDWKESLFEVWTMVLKRTSFHKWGSWCLPIFLLRDGSLTLMNMASLIVLAMVCDSLPSMEKLSSLI